eukprot:1140070-Pelagomonas_calceolata.AAC.3
MGVMHKKKEEAQISRGATEPFMCTLCAGLTCVLQFTTRCIRRPLTILLPFVAPRALLFRQRRKI